MAFVLRFYNLSSNPPSLDWDEAGNAWSSYSILKTGSDEYGHKFPITLRSFSDYKPAMYAYAMMPAIKLFGLNEFAVRFPSALAGSLLPLAIYLLFSLLSFSSMSFQRRLESSVLPLLAAFLTAINPWIIQFSRGGFEANLGLSLVLWGIVMMLCGRKTIIYILGLGLLVLSVYVYHANKFVAPVFAVLLTLYLFKKRKISRLAVVVAAIIMVLLLFPFSLTVQRGYGLSRLSGVAVGNVYDSLQNFLSHFNFDFLFLNGDGNARHHVLGFGLFYVFEAILMGAGIISFSKNFRHRVIFLVLFIVSLLPAAVAAEAPHAIRSILSFPFFLTLVVFGFVIIIKYKWGKFLLLTAYAYFFLFYVNARFKHYPFEVSQSWQYGYKQVAEFLFEENNYQKYDKIVSTTAYNQPYIYMLLYGGNRFLASKNDGTFQNGFAKFEFKKINWQEEKNRQNVLFVGTEDELRDAINVVDTIYFLDGKVAFKIVGS